MCVCVCVCVCVYLLADKQDKVFKTPKRKSHLSVHDDSHPVIDERQLFAAFSEISDWESVCINLGVANSHMDTIHHHSGDEVTKKEACLRQYYEYGQADWSHVVIAVAEPPLNNKRVACKIAHDHVGMDKKECHTFLGMDHDEL